MAVERLDTLLGSCVFVAVERLDTLLDSALLMTIERLEARDEDCVPPDTLAGPAEGNSSTLLLDAIAGPATGSASWANNRWAGRKLKLVNTNKAVAESRIFMLIK
ncbi:hypothetical protein H6G41_15720 [Tolypothrix sp. FACHB-123]|uniref:hypothetical protein n=1 Tax=Tolypothrix sp. FACHB-123 TaxID=2692868 RepID=UPI001682EFAD|nr:hypothetical protein [Tolypothrix sp. FACHB-123]MBD2356053.1 hypothetical protein [Tolypothrix sp. FACHB-123]